MAKSNKKIKIRLKKSLIGSTKKQVAVARGLGLTKTNQVVEHDESAIIMGMVNAIPHLLEVTK